MKNLAIIFLLILLTACSKEVEPMEEIVEDVEKIVEIVEVEEEEKEPVEEKEGIPSPLSGLYVAEDQLDRRPVVVMFDNHPRARWQAGLSQAEIVYEFLVEAPYTRYMGVFLVNEPESLGPIRSSRPYFVTALLEYDPLYVRVGGSQQAKADIGQLKIADIDALSSSNKVFWKKKDLGKRPPHNTYSSMEAIRRTQEERNYRMLGEFEGFKFHEDDEDLEGDKALEVDINYFKDNKTSYIYEPGEKVYYRYKDGKEHIDELDGSPIIAKNIIIQEAPTRIIDKEGRLAIDLIGEGRGKYISNGKAININWTKESRQDKTRFYSGDGEELVFNPGITWIQVVNSSIDIEIR